MTKFVYIDIYWLSVSLDPNRTRQKPHFPNRPEYSLMTRSNTLLRWKKFPVRTRTEFPRIVLKSQPDLAPLLSPRGSNPTKFPVFSQLAGNLGAQGGLGNFPEVPQGGSDLGIRIGLEKSGAA
jgi:hypothetical protein